MQYNYESGSGLEHSSGFLKRTAPVQCSVSIALARWTGCCAEGSASPQVLELVLDKGVP